MLTFLKLLLNLALRFWSHIVIAYAFTFWTCYILMREYGKVASMRLQFLAAEKRRPDQFTVNFIFSIFSVIQSTWLHIMVCSFFDFTFFYHFWAAL